MVIYRMPSKNAAREFDEVNLEVRIAFFLPASCETLRR
jgi:hypothetical protein